MEDIKSRVGMNGIQVSADGIISVFYNSKEETLFSIDIVDTPEWYGVSRIYPQSEEFNHTDKVESLQRFINYDTNENGNYYYYIAKQIQELTCEVNDTVTCYLVNGISCFYDTNNNLLLTGENVHIKKEAAD